MPGANVGGWIRLRILGAVKVKDGLFIGDELAAQDLEFIVANKVTRVINCCGRQVPNQWEPCGVVYLTYCWVDADNQIILDQRDVVANEIFRFVEQALECAESVLIHSVRGQSRSCCVLSAYMMKKYKWGLRKTMEFLSTRRPDLNLKPSFLQQLSGYERRLMSQSKSAFSLDWNDANFSRLESEELLLRNTYINSQMGPLIEFQTNDNADAMKVPKLIWMDNNTDDKLRLEKPAGADRHNLQNGSVKQNQQGQPVLTCILKKSKSAVGNGKTYEQVKTANRSTVVNVEQPALSQTVSEGFTPRSAGPPLTKGPQANTVIVNGLHGPLHMVPTAWAPPEGASSTPNSNPTSEPNRTVGNGANSVVPPVPYPEPAQQVFGSVHQPPQGPSLVQRGPATNIRDSVTGLGNRRDGSEAGSRPSSRPSSRDPSPNKTVGRGESPLHRGEVPMRALNGSTRRSPMTTASATHPRGSLPTNPASFGNLGVAFSGTRSTVSSGSTPAIGVMPGSNTINRGMNAFRSGGPVRAKTDILNDQGNSSLRRSRPATAPTMRNSVHSRPASPLGATHRSGSTSRPASPHTHAPQNKEVVPGPGYPYVYTYGPKHRAMPSSHMRRAPSPTPAFNRNPSPSKPRWRM